MIHLSITPNTWLSLTKAKTYIFLAVHAQFATWSDCKWFKTLANLLSISWYKIRGKAHASFLNFLGSVHWSLCHSSSCCWPAESHVLSLWQPATFLHLPAISFTVGQNGLQFHTSLRDIIDVAFTLSLHPNYPVWEVLQKKLVLKGFPPATLEKFVLWNT